MRTALVIGLFACLSALADSNVTARVGRRLETNWTLSFSSTTPCPPAHCSGGIVWRTEEIGIPATNTWARMQVAGAWHEVVLKSEPGTNWLRRWRTNHVSGAEVATAEWWKRR